MATNRTNILDVLRERICMVPPGKYMVFKEKELGDEFNLSRTPIRQLLQSLANEGMLEVKPGYGSVTSVLRPQDRAMHMEVFRQLALSASNLTMDMPMPDDGKIELAALHGFAKNVSEPTPEHFLRLNGRLVRALSMPIADPILHQAFEAAQWRVVRWRTHDMVQNLTQNWTIFTVNLGRAMEKSQSKSAGELLKIAADAVERYKDPETLRAVPPEVRAL